MPIGVRAASGQVDNEQALVNAVIGQSSFISMPPPFMTYSVAGALAVAGVLVLRVANIIHLGPKWFSLLGALVVSAVFLVRGGLGGKAVFGSNATELTEPFATLDKWIYSPLCLILGISILILIYAGARSKN